jgi:hypothetical protein
MCHRSSSMKHADDRYGLFIPHFMHFMQRKHNYLFSIAVGFNPPPPRSQYFPLISSCSPIYSILLSSLSSILLVCLSLRISYYRRSLLLLIKRPVYDLKYLLLMLTDCNKALEDNDANFEAFTAVMFQVAVFWVVTSCSIVVGYQIFRGPCCLHIPVEVKIEYSITTYRRLTVGTVCWWMIHLSVSCLGSSIQ